MDKTRENKARRKLSRMGYKLSKSSRKDPDAWDYGLYSIVDIQTNGLVHECSPIGTAHRLTLEDVEEWIQDELKSEESNAGTD